MHTQTAHRCARCHPLPCTHSEPCSLHAALRSAQALKFPLAVPDGSCTHDLCSSCTHVDRVLHRHFQHVQNGMPKKRLSQQPTNKQPTTNKTRSSAVPRMASRAAVKLGLGRTPLLTAFSHDAAAAAAPGLLLRAALPVPLLVQRSVLCFQQGVHGQLKRLHSVKQRALQPRQQGHRCGGH